MILYEIRQYVTLIECVSSEFWRRQICVVRAKTEYHFHFGRKFHTQDALVGKNT